LKEYKKKIEEIIIMGDVEIVVKVPEGVNPEEVVRKARALAAWEAILESARRRKARLRAELKGESEEFERFVGEGEEIDLC